MFKDFDKQLGDIYSSKNNITKFYHSKIALWNIKL